MTNEHQPITKAERLSALIDNESEAFASRRLIDDLLKSPDDRGQWARYHLIGDCLRGGVRQLAPRDFLAGIQAGIADVAPPQAPATTTNLPRWLKPVAGLGVAAAVAVVSLAGLQMLGPVNPMGAFTPLSGVSPAGDTARVATVAEVPLLSPPRSVLLASEETASDPTLASSPDPRFAPYLENHAELFAPGSSAFARVRNSVADE